MSAPGPTPRRIVRVHRRRAGAVTGAHTDAELAPDEDGGVPAASLTVVGAAPVDGRAGHGVDDAGGDLVRSPGPDRVARRNWSVAGVLLALVAALVAGGLAAASVVSEDPTYRSTTVVEIRRDDLFLDVNPGTISVLNALRSKYAALINTEPIVTPAARAAGVAPGVVRSSVGASITADSLLFYPYAVADTPEGARRLAQAATESLLDYATDEQRAAGVPGDERIDLRIVQDAFPGSEIGPSTRRAGIVAVAAGGVAALAAYGAVEALSRRRRRS